MDVYAGRLRAGWEDKGVSETVGGIAEKWECISCGATYLSSWRRTPGSCHCGSILGLRWRSSRTKIKSPMPPRATRVSRGCHWCGRPMTVKRQLEKLRSTDATRDHVIPISKGGKNEAENRVRACNRCNGLKGNMLPDAWRAWMERHPERLTWDE